MSKSKPRRLFGAPQPEKFKTTDMGRLLQDCAAIHYKKEDSRNVDRLLAIEKLTLDIFQNSDAARAFAVNPDEYLKRNGLSGVSLDLNSQEVRVAMAIGDPIAQQAAWDGDIEGFIDAILAQGIKPASGIGRFVHVEALVHSSVVVYFIAAVVTYQKVVTATAIPIAVIGPPIFESSHHRSILGQIAAHLGDNSFSKKVEAKLTDTLVSKYTQLMERKTKG